MGARVTASHTTAMHSAQRRVCVTPVPPVEKMSGINFVANPLVNIHLQGRFDTCEETSWRHAGEEDAGSGDQRLL